jgi:hypothetical protein
MKTLLLAAPKDKDTASGLHRAFNHMIANRVGPEYAIAKSLLIQIVTGMKVVVFDRAGHGRQAQGVVAGVKPTGNKTRTGMLRYNVLIRDLNEVAYTRPPNVNRYGVGFTG